MSQSYLRTFESFISEKFKPEKDRDFPRCIAFKIFFRDYASKENSFDSEKIKSDFEAAKKMIDAYRRANKIKQEAFYSKPPDSDLYEVSFSINKKPTLMKNYGGSKTDDYDRGINLMPLYVKLSKLETAQEEHSSHVPMNIG